MSFSRVGLRLMPKGSLMRFWALSRFSSTGVWPWFLRRISLSCSMICGLSVLEMVIS